jgi:Rrf2 family iron-sulfur cluster assembly transcriptional regulator
MKITTRSSYTVRALLDLAQNSVDGRPVRLSDISRREGISHAYLEQLFNRLKKVEVVRGRKGPGGGYILAKIPERVLMGEVIKAVEGEEKLFLCTEEHSDGESCQRYPGCTTHLLWEKLSASFQDYLNSISLADLLKGEVSPDK